MSVRTDTRKWSVEVACGGQPVVVSLDEVRDTLADTRAAAIAEASLMIREYELGSDASVVLFKTTKARGTERHSSCYVYRDYATREIRVQR